jgi:hypothetical protein
MDVGTGQKSSHGLKPRAVLWAAQPKVYRYSLHSCAVIATFTWHLSYGKSNNSSLRINWNIFFFIQNYLGFPEGFGCSVRDFCTEGRTDFDKKLKTGGLVGKCLVSKSFGT